MILLDCTLRDGGYYNNWDFDHQIIEDYLKAMDSLKIDFVEIGFRSLKNNGFKGAVAYSTDTFLNSISIPSGLVGKIGIMINGSEISNPKTQLSNLQKLFSHKSDSAVSLVRVACHADEFEKCLPASKWLTKQGYQVGFNLMQVADCSEKKITKITKAANNYPVDVLYFADSLGSMDQEEIKKIIKTFKKNWKGQLGIHAHDNTAQALGNTLQAVKSGATWVDSTVTGMGRGAGNAQTEHIVLALEDYRKKKVNLIKILELINKYFIPMKTNYRWGTNPFYYLAGKHNIHPSYIQEMIQDSRFNEEDILSVIDFLKNIGGKKFSFDKLETARHFYSSKPKGKWKPISLLKNKTVLILGSGPGIKKYQTYIENFIERTKPFVVALNTQSNIKQNLINVRVACHPVRLLADCKDHLSLPQPLITPFSMLPKMIKSDLAKKEIFDFGMSVKKNTFKFNQNFCEIPNSLVIAYSFAIANSGKANHILLAGFDGYNAEDPRCKEIDQILDIYNNKHNILQIESITPTKYKIPIKSIFSL